MAHEVETMMSVREVPWHKLGTILDDYPANAVEAAKAAGLDWEVDLAPVYFKTNGKYEEFGPEARLVYRTSDKRPLGVVGGRFTPLQNSVMFEFAEALLDTGDVKFETAGSLREGRWVWALAKVERPVKVAGDEVLPYLLVTNGHDGLQAFTARVTPVRVVCANTLSMAMRDTRRSWQIRHTASAPKKVDEARLTIGLAYEYFDAFETEVDKLIEQALTDRQFENIVRELRPVSENERSEKIMEQQREEIRALYYNPGQEQGFTGTAWGCLNAVSEWELWTRPRATSDEGDFDATASQAQKIIRDKATPLTNRAHKVLVERRPKALAAK